MSQKRLYILRHGDAEPYNFAKDSDRRLTPEGVKEVQSIATQFYRHEQTIEQMYVSPYRRAQETADHFSSTLLALGNKDKITRTKLASIIPSGDPRAIAGWLSEQEANSILLITHQPFAAQLADLLADAPLPHNFMMKTGTMVALEGELLAAACCSFRWVKHAF